MAKSMSCVRTSDKIVDLHLLLTYVYFLIYAVQTVLITLSNFCRLHFLMLPVRGMKGTGKNYIYYGFV